MDPDGGETTTRYVCSACGFSRGDPEAVVRHIEGHEDRDGVHVMEYESEAPEASGLLGRLREWLP